MRIREKGDGTRREEEKVSRLTMPTVVQRESAPIAFLSFALSRSLSCILPIRSSSVRSRSNSHQSPKQKTQPTKQTDGLKHFSSLPSPWGIPLVGHGPLLGRAPAATLKRWADKYGGVYR